MYTIESGINSQVSDATISVMEPFSSCVVKISSKSEKSSPVNYREVLCELDKALETQSYEIVCMGNQNAFSIADLGQEDKFATYVQFDFPLPVTDLEKIEEEIRLQIDGACSIDTIKSTDRYRLLLVEKCDISFR